MLSEQYDFGSARRVNSLFHDLLTISPFSKDEVKKYGDFLSDRNLLVHHGGIYTSKYARRKFATKEIKNLAHFQSLVVNKGDVREWGAYLKGLATKMANACRGGLRNFVVANGIKLDPQRSKAVKFIGK